MSLPSHTNNRNLLAGELRRQGVYSTPQRAYDDRDKDYVPETEQEAIREWARVGRLLRKQKAQLRNQTKP